MPRITVVTPCLNQAAYLEDALRSVLEQEYPDLEHIVMDGGSSDGCREIVGRYSDRLAYWQSAADAGQADAIYQGFEKATGSVLCWLNGDDLLLPGALMKVGRYFAAHPTVECVVGGCVIIDGASRTQRRRWGLPDFNLGARVTLQRLVYAHGYFNQPATFWRRESFFAVGGFDRQFQFCFDYDMYLRLAQRRSFGRIKDLLACFRIHPESKTSRLQSVRNEENGQLWRKYGRDHRSPAYRRWLQRLCVTERNLEYIWYFTRLAAGLVQKPQPVGEWKLGRLADPPPSVPWRTVHE